MLDSHILNSSFCRTIEYSFISRMIIDAKSIKMKMWHTPSIHGTSTATILPDCPFSTTSHVTPIRPGVQWIESICRFLAAIAFGFELETGISKSVIDQTSSMFEEWIACIAIKFSATCQALFNAVGFSKINRKNSVGFFILDTSTKKIWNYKYLVVFNIFWN